MIILTDCLTEKVDEGCLKVANNLAKRIKKSDSDTVLISYGRGSANSDLSLRLNKLFLNRALFSEIKAQEGSVLYIPFASNTLASILRSCVLSLFSKRRVYALFALRHPMGKLAKWILKKSRFFIVALSAKSFDYYSEMATDRVLYLRTGVDTQRFCPIDGQKKLALKKKYGFDGEKPVVLHVGHLHSGRNVEILEHITENKQVVLVVSSVSKQDQNLRKRLNAKQNIRIIDQYLPDIQEIYQLSDIYLFPVENEENCIDVPLSVLEAAACNTPIVTTAYGELTQFAGRPGIMFVETMDPDLINSGLDRMLDLQGYDNRSAVEQYDWDRSVRALKALME